MIDETPSFHQSLADCMYWPWQEADEALARRFRQAVRETLQSVEAMPLAGRAWELRGAQDVRMHLVRGFPNYIVFYEPVEGGVRALLVVHGARDLESLLEDG